MAELAVAEALPLQDELVGRVPRTGGANVHEHVLKGGPGGEQGEVVHEAGGGAELPSQQGYGGRAS